MKDVPEKSLSDKEQEVMNALKKVIDPELGIDLVNLGLIYGVSIDEQKNCEITMTLTTMGCPISDVLYSMIKKAVLSVPEVEACKINLVWEPAWSPQKMSRFARIALGIRV
ncbi:MAG: metal-sulfur cluster assembly factor [Limosilactobacillus sp.]|jgi:metal-sulfur cluster biosynthetic enzyme|uniref:metal-sulfur cluster assembly factor n=1 Tax=Limosilactobacillus sp. TaxID=2773925 RepID=UPI0025C2754B|nr:metal-sulfur cluster assembly factor [Limosilactobacillus sp.]MCI1975227.1 metal-sulfur cluster assembly factor [Limosilactobacillus sp.]MCI2031301.1 metal-sulfur cluster assembly factor [Limosilactobacillus sp.]